jgi:hypothetical protein
MLKLLNRLRQFVGAISPQTHRFPDLEQEPLAVVGSDSFKLLKESIHSLILPAPSYTAGMGLFQKGNPNATKPGLAVVALLGAPLGVVVGWLMFHTLGPPDMFSRGMALYWALMGSVSCSAIYWNGWPD